MGPPYGDGWIVPRSTRHIFSSSARLRSPVGMSLQVNKHLTNVSAGNTNGISPLTMPDGSESVVSCAAAGDGDGALNESVKELDFTSSPGTQSFKEPEDVFSPSQVGSPSTVESYGGRRRVRILFGEQDPEKNPELFTPPRKVTSSLTPSTSGPPRRRPKITSSLPLPPTTTDFWGFL